jgi:hypothetical protein
VISLSYSKYGDAYIGYSVNTPTPASGSFPVDSHILVGQFKTQPYKISADIIIRIPMMIPGGFRDVVLEITCTGNYSMTQLLSEKKYKITNNSAL